jgi:hypothetical protein
MKESKESPVFLKTLDFVVWLIPLTNKFPRQQRFVIAAALQRDALALHEALVRAAHSDTPQATMNQLHEAGVHLTLMRFHLRLCLRWALITAQQDEYALERLAEIGRLVRAWQQSCVHKTNRADQVDRANQAETAETADAARVPRSSAKA